MNGKTLLVAGAAVVLAVVLTRWLWPAERVRTVQLPGSTDTVEVTREELDTVWRERVRWRERVTTDTLLLADTVWETAVETVAVLLPRWYLDRASVAQTYGDTSYYRLTWLAADSGGIRRREAVERHVTLGPVRQIETDSTGLSVDYGTFPEPGCQFECKAKIILGTAGITTLINQIISLLTGG